MSKFQFIFVIVLVFAIILNCLHKSGSSTLENENKEAQITEDYKEFDKQILRPDPEVYTQGTFFSYENEKYYLYVSGGLYQKSTISKYEYPSLNLIARTKLDDSFFGEGIAKVGEYVYQQTWRERALLKYKASDLSTISTLIMDPAVTEGWGLSNGPNNTIIATDGSSKVIFLDLDFKFIKSVETGTRNLNEIRYIGKLNGKELALCNVYLTKTIVLINLNSGKILKTYDLSKIVKSQIESRPDRADYIENYGDCLNGIAIQNEADTESKSVKALITGKRWDRYYAIEFDLKHKEEKN